MAGIAGGLVWILLVGVQAFRCALAGSGGQGNAAPAVLPCLALCAFGVALWRRSRWAVVLAPGPLGLGAALHAAGWLVPRTFGSAVCAFSVEGIGPFTTVSSVLVLFAVALPVTGLAALRSEAPAQFERARRLIPSRRIAWPVAVVALAVLVAVLIVRRRPLRLGEDFDDFSHSLPRRDQVPPPDLRDRVGIVNVMIGRLDGGQGARLGALLEERLGPIEWMTHATDPDKRYVTATGHFPPSVWRPPFDGRATAFDGCVGAIRGRKNDEVFIRDFADWWHGRLTGQQVNEKWWSSRRDVFESEWQAFERGELTAEEIERRWSSRAPGAELYTKLLNCEQATPSISEEEFSRVVFQWRCAGVECSWVFIDPDAWTRVLPVPCRDTGPRRCVAEAFRYLAAGSLTAAPVSAPAGHAPVPVR